MRKRSDKYPHATPYTDRHGKTRWRYRHKGASAELGTAFGSDDFKRRYQAAEDGVKRSAGAGASRTAPGTLDDLAVRFYALHFPNIEPSTRADYRAVIEPLRLRHGRKRIAHLAVPHVMAIKAGLAATPSQANKTLKRLRQMIDLAVELQWRTDNPARAVKFYKVASDGFHAWDEGEIARFYEMHEPGSPAHLAMTLMLYTGAAKVDAVKLGRANVSGGRIVYRRQKTRKNPSGIAVDIPIHPALAAALEARPGGFTFLETADGKSRSVKGLGTAMRKWCDKAGLPLCSSHGLRKAICRRIAEAGGAAHEIMAVSGHVTLTEVQRYCDTFGRKGLADAAIGRIGGTETEQKLTNHPARFVKKSPK